jgi:hypothetical protein
VARAQTKYERSRFERDLALTLAGMDGEKEAAYYIDFHLKDSRNWMVIHDLRLEWDGRVAQIDHLIINRMLEMYVVESKNLKTKVRYQNGGWERVNGREWEGFPCPVEQNRRHIYVVKELIESKQLTPTRLGVNLSPSYFNVVAVNPACSIVGGFPKDVKVWKMDGVARELLDDIGNPLALLSVVAPETLEAFARKLVACHRPACGREQPGNMELRDTPMTMPGMPRVDAAADNSVCEGCGGVVTKAESSFCRMNKGRFAGKVLCRKCQGFAPKVTQKAAVKLTAKENATAKCVECGTEVDGKVVAFCRFNSKRFNKRVLCRECQEKS